MRHVRNACPMKISLFFLSSFFLPSWRVLMPLVASHADLYLTKSLVLFSVPLNFVTYKWQCRNTFMLCSKCGHILPFCNLSKSFLLFCCHLSPILNSCVFLVLTIAEHSAGIFKQLFPVNPTCLYLADKNWTRTLDCNTHTEFNLGCLFLDRCFASTSIRCNQQFHQLILHFFNVCLLVSSILKIAFISTFSCLPTPIVIFYNILKKSHGLSSNQPIPVAGKLITMYMEFWTIDEKIISVFSSDCI